MNCQYVVDWLDISCREQCSFAVQNSVMVFSISESLLQSDLMAWKFDVCVHLSSFMRQLLFASKEDICIVHCIHG